MFNQGGTLASTDNQPPSSRGPGSGTWENIGGRSYSAPFQVFSFNPDGTFAGTVKIARNILLAADANSYTSTVSVEILDPNGNMVATLCGTESATRLFDGKHLVIRDDKVAARYEANWQAHFRHSEYTQESD